MKIRNFGCIFVLIIMVGCNEQRAAVPEGMVGASRVLWNSMMCAFNYSDGRLVAIAKEFNPSGPNDEYPLMAVSINPEKFNIYAVSQDYSKLAFIYDGKTCIYDKEKMELRFRYHAVALVGITRMTWNENVVEMWRGDNVVFRCGVK